MVTLLYGATTTSTAPINVLRVFVQTLVDHGHELFFGDFPVTILVHLPELLPDLSHVWVPEIQIRAAVPFVFQELCKIDTSVSVGVGLVKDLHHGVDEGLATAIHFILRWPDHRLDHLADGFHAGRTSTKQNHF